MTAFDCFVIFAEMRTGSNALEEAINQVPGLVCHGEAFNPVFIGHQSREKLFGVDLSEREADPLSLLQRMKDKTKGLPGFRFFHDHDARMAEAILPDPRCAKVILTRNPVEQYISLKIARATGQWKLTDAKDRKRAKVRFDAAEFEEMRSRQDAFRARVRRALQVTGQSAFEIDQTEIGDLDVLNGLARFLGVDGRLERLDRELKRQNPEPLRDRVENPEEMEAALGGIDMGAGPPPEPAHGALVPTYVAAVSAPLLFVPVKGGPTARIELWLAMLDGADREDLQRNFTRKTLRQWKNRNKDGRTFSVVSHPVERAHRVFCRYILSTGPGSFAEIRAALRERYGVPLPDGVPGPGYDEASHLNAFLGFLRVAKANLAGQTGFRTDPAWSSQWALLSGAADAVMPDMIVREPTLARGLAQLAEQTGLPSAPAPGPDIDDGAAPFPLAAIYGDAVEAAVRDLHNRDYMTFGFRRWQPLS